MHFSVVCRTTQHRQAQSHRHSILYWASSNPSSVMQDCTNFSIYQMNCRFWTPRIRRRTLFYPLAHDPKVPFIKIPLHRWTNDQRPKSREPRVQCPVSGKWRRSECPLGTRGWSIASGTRHLCTYTPKSRIWIFLLLVVQGTGNGTTGTTILRYYQVPGTRTR